MTNHEYLKSILENEKIDHTVEETKSTRAEVKDFLMSYYKDENKNPTFIYSGSIAKKTAVKSKYDIDVGLLFYNEDFSSLEEMFEDVRKTLEKEYGRANTREQNVSIRISKNGHEIDVVPGRKLVNNKNDVYLHVQRDENTRVKSNLEKHVDEISTFGELETIRLLKIWKIKKGFKFKSFALELMTKKALDGTSLNGLDAKFKYMMEYIVDNIDSISLIDPANTNNNVAETLTDHQKSQIKKFARRALKCIDKNKWNCIFDDGDGKCLDDEDGKRARHAFYTSSATHPKPHAR